MEPLSCIVNGIKALYNAADTVKQQQYQAKRLADRLLAYVPLIERLQKYNIQNNIPVQRAIMNLKKVVDQANQLLQKFTNENTLKQFLLAGFRKEQWADMHNDLARVAQDLCLMMQVDMGQVEKRVMPEDKQREQTENQQLDRYINQIRIEYNIQQQHIHNNQHYTNNNQQHFQGGFNVHGGPLGGMIGNGNSISASQGGSINFNDNRSNTTIGNQTNNYNGFGSFEINGGKGTGYNPHEVASRRRELDEAAERERMLQEKYRSDQKNARQEDCACCSVM